MSPHIRDRTRRALSFALAVLTIALFGSVEAWAQAHETHTGSGDDVVEISKPDDGLPALLVVSGNREGRHFAVIAHDESGGRLGALVNTTEPYVGIVPIDLPPTSSTTLLEVSATGSWRIQVYSIGAAQRITVPETFEGDGDNVLWVEGNPSRATIRGNSGSRHFAVIAYDGNGNRLGAQVNTTDPYSGTVVIPRQTLLLQISAVGTWSIDIR